MTEASPTSDTDKDNDDELAVQQVATLGTSPAGESFEVVRVPTDDQSDGDDLVGDADEPQRFVLKKLTESRFRAPERFRQKFSALCRLDHPNLCPYRDLYIGETATRITRDYVAGTPLDEYLLQPITEEERQQLERPADDGAPDGDDSAQDDTDQSPHSEDIVDGHNNANDDAPVDTADATDDDSADAAAPDSESADQDGDNRPSTLEIPTSLLEDSAAANRALDLIILRLQRILPRLIDALEYLHRFQHVHGNLTPSNIIITSDGQPVLTDYGLYPELVIPSDAWRRHATYHGPEVDGGNFLPKSDLYALGSVLFEALADRPYGARRKTETPDGSETHFSPVYLSEIVPHCPATWVDLIHGLLAPEPGDRPPLDEVHRQLAATEPRSVNIPASVVDEPDTLYGRRDNLERLTESAQNCSQHRQLGIASVEGPTGVGKTAVLDALARQCTQRGWVVLHGRCFHREPVAYQGWERIVDRLATIADQLPETPRKRLTEDRRRAARIFPQLGVDDSGDLPNIDRSDAVDGFRNLIAGLSDQRPILICFDDIHWAGFDSSRLLADLAESPRGMRLMIATTWRPTDIERREHPFWSEIETAPVDVERISIEGFTKDEARQYVLTHGRHLSLRQKQKVLRRGGLNPLLIDELIHEFQTDSPVLIDDDSDDDPGGSDDSDDSDDADDTSSVDDGDDGDEGASDSETPDAIDHYLETFIEERLRELSRAERLVVQLLSIASGPLAPDLLARAMDRELGSQTAELVSGREVAESLVEQRLARRARRIEPSADETPRYVVVHDLCRRVVLDELGRDHHARLCGLIAEALGSSSTQTDDLRFEYLLRAGRGDEATRAAVLAARTANRRFAYHRATRLWSWLDEAGELDDRDRPDFAAALFGAAQYSEAVEQYDRLLPAPSLSVALPWHRRRIDALLSAGRRSDAIDATEDALHAASVPYQHRTLTQRLGDVRRRLTTGLSRWSNAAAIATDEPPDDATCATAQLLDATLHSGPLLASHATPHIERRFADIAFSSRYGPLLARDRLWMIGAPWLPFLARDGSKFDRWIDQATELSERFEDSALSARSLETSALLARHRADLDAADDYIDDARHCLDISTVTGPHIDTRLIALRIDIALLRGNIEDASQLVDRFIHRTRHSQWQSAVARLSAADCALLAGRLDRADHHLDIVRDFIGDDRNCLLHLWLIDRHTRLWIARDQSEVAIATWDLLLDRVYTRGIRRRPRVRMLIHLNLGCALAALAGRQKALGEAHLRDTLRRLRRAVRRLGDLQTWMGVFDRCRFFRLQSRLELLRSRPERAHKSARRAIDIAGSSPPIVVEALNREACGHCVRHLDDADARPMLDEARTTYRELGITLPLVMEGWPVPEGHARLGPDD